MSTWHVTLGGTGRTVAALPVLAALALLPGCGGGGGSPAPQPAVQAVTPPRPQPQPQQVCYRTAEFGCLPTRRYEAERGTLEDGHNREDDFTNQWGLAAIRADRAYAQLELRHGAGTEPGSGQTVGIIDYGIDTGHPFFAGKTVTEHFFGNATDETGLDGFSHGTAVASVIAGRPSDRHARDTGAARGVARGADVAMFVADTLTAAATYSATTPSALDGVDEIWATRFDHVIGWRNGARSIDFLNLSWVFPGIIDQYTSEVLDDNFGSAIEAMAQENASEKTIFVWAAGNDQGSDCEAADFTGHPHLCVNGKLNASSVTLLAGLPARIPELRGHTIAVVAVAPDGDGDGDYEIARFSNRCGIAAEWCIAAPGESIRTAYFGPDPDNPGQAVRDARSEDGTSVAASMVTGGLVLLKSHFRNQLSNTALVSRLMATANSSGIYATGSIYGQGLMDLGAATAPVGTTRVALGARVDGPGSALAGTRFAPGGALGDGLAQAFAGHEIATFDTLGAPFWLPLAALAGAAPRPSAAARLGALMAPRRQQEPAALAGGERLSLGVMQAPAATGRGGHLALAGGALALRSEARGLGIAAFSTEGLRGRAPASGATLSWRPEGSPLGLAGGWVAERETVLGSGTAGAFGRLSGASAFAGIDGGAQIGSWRLGAGAEIGTVKAASRGGMIASVSPLTTSAFALTAQRTLANGDGLEISLAQPLRVEAGRARLSVPTGRTKDGRVLRRALTAGLEPSGRQFDLAAHWRRSLSAGGEIGLGAVLTDESGHDASADPELTLLAGWRHAF